MSYASWNGINFEVTPALVRSFKDLQLTASCETEDKTKDKEKWVALKTNKPYELSLTMHIDRRAGSNDVQDEAQKILAKAYAGETGAFTIGGRPVLPMGSGAGFNFMCTQASVTGIELMRNGDWLGCDIKLTFKQACNNAGATTESSKKSSGGSSGSKKSSSKSSSSKKSSTKKNEPLQNDYEKAQKEKFAQKKAEQAAKKTTDTAKKQSTAKKKSSAPSRAKHVEFNPGATNWAR